MHVRVTTGYQNMFTNGTWKDFTGDYRDKLVKVQFTNDLRELKLISENVAAWVEHRQRWL